MIEYASELMSHAAVSERVARSVEMVISGKKKNGERDGDRTRNHRIDSPER